VVEKLHIRAEDGAEHDAALFAREPSQAAEAIVVCSSAMGVPARFYESFARALAERGPHVITAELRGNGSSSVRPRRGVDFGYSELALQDLPAVIARARSISPGAPIFLFGHSLGAQVNLLYASAHPDTIRGLIVVAAGSPYYRNWSFPRSLGVLVSSQLMRGISSALGYFPGRRLGFAGTEARRLIHEWASFAASGRLRPRGLAHDFEARIRELTLPLLGVSFEDDRFAPREAMDHLLAKVPRATLTRRHLRPAELGVPALNHFQWAKQPAPVAELIAEWIRAATC
jgi:predicted alpha/beta hydrolase